jgi:hypothetical protein
MAESTRVNKTFYEATNFRLKQTSILKAFNILQDTDRITEYLNIFKALKLNTDKEFNLSFFNTYETENDDWWDNISYVVYGTPHLWWVVCLFNNVFNPFEELEDGQNLKILKPVFVYQLFKDMDQIREL